MNKLMLLLDGASEFDRRLLRGLVRYTRENGDWLFFRVPLALQHDGDDTRGDGERIVEMARNWGANAIVGVSFGYETMGQANSMIMISISGTAVVID